MNIKKKIDMGKENNIKVEQLRKLYMASDDANMVNLYANGIHQLLNVQLLYFDYIEDILRKWGLCAQSTKHNINMCKRVFNAFERDMQRNIATREQQDNFNEEFDKLYDALSKYFLTCVDDDKNNKTKGDKDDK